MTSDQSQPAPAEDQDEDLLGSEGSEREPSPLEEVFWMFREAELPFPPIPRELAGELRPLDQWLFASREIEASPLDLDLFLDEAIAGEAPDYVLLGQAGYGISNLAIHYFLVVGPLALFVQVRWGGAYTDNEAAVARMRGAFSGAEELIVAAEAARADGRLGPRERLVVVDSEREGRRFARVEVGSDEGAIAWCRAADPVVEALVGLST
jgi:hypothetical protein